MTQEIAKSTPADSISRPLEVFEWVNLNLTKWKAWDFGISEVYRTPKYHFIFQRVKAQLSEFYGDESKVVINGLWYRVDDGMEKKLEKMVWTAWFLAILAFALALMTLGAGFDMVAVLLFVIMFVVLEGFLPFSFNKLAPGRKRGNIEIKLSSLEKVLHFRKSGTVLMSFVEDGVSRGIGFRMNHNVAESFIKRVKKQPVINKDIFQVSDCNPVNPPDKKAVK